MGEQFQQMLEMRGPETLVAGTAVGGRLLQPGCGFPGGVWGAAVAGIVVGGCGRAGIQVLR